MQRRIGAGWIVKPIGATAPAAALALLALVSGLAAADVATARGRLIRELARAGHYHPFRALALDALCWPLALAALLAAIGAVWLLRRRRTLRAPWPLVLVLIAASAWAGYRLGWRPLFVMAEDFPSYYFAGAVVAEGGDPYDETALRRVAEARLTRELSAVHRRAGLPPPLSRFRGRIFPYLYPPLTAALVAPAAKLPYRVAQQLWTVANVAALALLLLLAARLAERPGAALACAALLLLVYQPLARNADTGQINLWVALAAWSAFDLDRRGRWTGAGGLLALAAHLKLSPGLLAPVFAVRGRIRTLAAAAVAVLLLFGLTGLTAGSRARELFFRELLPRYSKLGAVTIPDDLRSEALVLPNNPDPVRAYHEYPAVRVVNQSPLALAGMIAARRGAGAWAAIRSTQAVLASVWLATLWTAWRNRRRDPFPVFAAASVLVLLSSPLLWQHHLVWMVVPLCWLASRLWQKPSLTLGVGFLAVLLLTSRSYGFAPLGLPRELPWAYGQLAGLFLLWALLTLQAWSGPAPPAHPRYDRERAMDR